MSENRTVRVAVNGAAGRMGRRLVALCRETEGLELAAALESAGNEAMGADAGELAGVGRIGVAVATALPASGVDVLIDFSLPAGTKVRVAECAKAGVAMVIGTTGLDAETEKLVAEAAKKVAVVHAPNMSVGINVLLKTAAELARVLGPAYDVEIVESHHRFKKDAPSGTALGLAKSIAEATGRNLADDACYGREGACPRGEGEIGIHAVRAGDIVGEHTIIYGALGERVELRHVASTRDTFVRGALRAAQWVAGKPAGLYSMQDVLGL
ncbi:MAG: 4-hydroxy-tetrahydrodipicolinate reductase [Planctomycetes bacterium]|nr:4-hydroxy-tetrahydrodipicolinate reductase [Planctomycetota bacterium]